MAGEARLPVELIYAVAENGVIGRDNAMPWRLPTDLKRFKALTLGNAVIMGRRTFESIGRPLPKRTNIVVTRQCGYAHEGIHVVSSPAEALALARSLAVGNAISVIGGAEIYQQLLPEADRLHVTHVDARPNGDTRMDPIDGNDWRLVRSERAERSENDSAGMTFATYERRS